MYSTNSGRLAYSLHLPSEQGLPNTCLRWRPTSTTHKTKNILAVASRFMFRRLWTIQVPRGHWSIGMWLPRSVCTPSLRKTIKSMLWITRKMLKSLQPQEKTSRCRLRNFSHEIASSVWWNHQAVNRDTIRRVNYSVEQLLKWHSHGDETAGHANRIFSVHFHPTNPNMIISGGWDNTIQVQPTSCVVTVTRFGIFECNMLFAVFSVPTFAGTLWTCTKTMCWVDPGDQRILCR